MTCSRRIRNLGAAAACAVASFAVPAAPAAAAQADEAARARELIALIQKEMAEIDRLLLESDPQRLAEARAKAGENAANIEKLLEDAKDRQNQVCDYLEELVAQTKYQQGQSGGEPPPEPPPDGEPQQNRERERDADPEQLRYQGRPEEQRPENRPQEGEQQPEDGRPDPSKGRQNESGREPPRGDTEEFERDDATGRWGVLPPKVAEMFQNLSPEQLPEKYRKLIYDYYRKQQAEKSGP